VSTFIMQPSYQATLLVLPIHLSLCLSICLTLYAPNSKTKMRRKTKIGVNVPLGRSNQCANF